jgi:hypothetical protein
MLPDLTPQDLALALDREVERTLVMARVSSPPVDALRVADALGLVVVANPDLPERACYVGSHLSAPTRAAAPRAGVLAVRRRMSTRGTIVVRPEPRFERVQWAIAHEIGEHLARRVFHRLGLAPRAAPPTAREAIANRFAGRLLAPTRWFESDGSRCDWRLPDLKRRYETASHELLSRRMLDAPPRVIVSIFDQGRLGFRRGNQPGRTPAVTPTERRVWQEVHGLGRARECEAGFGSEAPFVRVACWPVHDAGWRREIMRTEIGAEYD